MDDLKLIERLKSGEATAFQTLLDQYEENVFRLACRMLGSNDAEDAVQDVFIGIFKNLNSFRGDSKLSTWIYRIAVNTCLMQLRKRRPEEVPIMEEFEIEDTSLDAESIAIHNMEMQQIEAAIAKLDEQHKVVVILHELHQMTYQEVADTLNVPVGTVKSRLHYAFQQLRRMLRGVTAEAN